MKTQCLFKPAKPQRNFGFSPTKAALVRNIQATEGNPECLATSGGGCAQTKCSCHDECRLAPSRSGQVVTNRATLASCLQTLRFPLRSH